ncbi:hypothetical protein [Novosphingobium resinovorum]|uniref:hypothetical protein n=1 Tax=Novosphingobium resinovorum TaxID=158500 RepID=UPI002ED261DB|nr:hypothetical protein [Novosphingobium resinovorum]
MSLGKLALLLVVGGLAGATFAAVTTRSLSSHASFEHLPTDRPAPRSWLDEGLSALDTPAWPFGPEVGDDRGELAEGPPDDYAADGYGLSERYADEAWERRRDIQYGQPVTDVQSPAPDAVSEPSPITRRQDDAASAAAARAADAAQDVMAAEGGQ